MDDFRNDLRFALRVLVRQPGFTSVVLLTLALGIGATTGVFSAVRAALLSSLPFSEPDRLVMGRRTQDGRVGRWVSAHDYVDYREQSKSFTSLAAAPFRAIQVTETGGAEPERLDVIFVSHNLFDTLRVSPVIGRAFSAEDGRAEPAVAPGPPSPYVAMISVGFWNKRFAGAGNAVGSTLTLMGQPVTVVGVVPGGLDLLGEADVWLPMRLNGPYANARRFHNWLVVGRLAPGVTLTQAQAEVDAISTRLSELYPDSNTGKGLHLDSLHEALVENLRPQLLVIMAAVTLMLLIASGNVANLLLARGVTRRREIAIRVSLGASRGRLVRQLVTESVILATLGGAVGLALAAALQRLLPSLLDLRSVGVESLRLDTRLLLFAFLLSLLTGLAVGLVPAWRSTRVSSFTELKGGSRTITSRSGARLRLALVASQVTLSLVLLIGSALLVRSFAKLAAVNLGFEPGSLLVGDLQLPPDPYDTNDERIEFFGGLLEEIRAIPGVEAAGMVTQLPIISPGNDIYVWTPDRPPQAKGVGQTAHTRTVLPGYFAAMGMSLVAGRDLSPADRSDAPRALVINQTMGATMFPGESPIGRQVVVDMGGDEPVTFEVVGVVADARLSRVGSEPYPAMYHSYFQFPARSLALVIRSNVALEGITSALRDRVRRRDARIPVESLSTMKAAIRRSTQAQRTLTGAVSSFSLLALLLASIGLFGVLAYQVNQRQHEIGIRMALGAQRGHVLATVLRQGLTVTALGMAAGAVAGLLLTRLMSGLLYAVAPSDPASFLGAAACLLVVALLACVAPALRALAIHPVNALRYE